MSDEVYCCLCGNPSGSCEGGCGCDTCDAGERAGEDWICDACLRAEAVADDALLGEVEL